MSDERKMIAYPDCWTMVVKVRLHSAMEHSEGIEALKEIIRDEGGLMAVISGWCDEDDLELVSLEPISVDPDAAEAERSEGIALHLQEGGEWPQRS